MEVNIVSKNCKTQIKYIMEQMHTTEFDAVLQQQLTHLNNYPEMLPFIGSKWNESNIKTLIIAESHYADTACFTEAHFNNWYETSSKDFKLKDNYYTDYINTRNVINIAENTNKFGFKKPLLIFYNIINEVKKHIPKMQNQQHIFPYFSFYNYFQRPASIQSASIINALTLKDREVAYQTIKSLTQTILPRRIIFASRLSYNTFIQSKQNEKGNLLFENINIENIPHPGSAWWNKRSANYGKDETQNRYRTGKEKFIHLIKS
ncbi:MAG TPA: hypothetical protein PLH49_13560 [Chitinophagaceae bacterium]|nr:hypothetical protein [Chitinophagaceae bacterium]HNK91126.1 hypothetical protein [Chitinophagales bacterium]